MTEYKNKGIGCNNCYACVSGGSSPCQNEKFECSVELCNPRQKTLKKGGCCDECKMKISNTHQNLKEIEHLKSKINKINRDLIWYRERYPSYEEQCKLWAVKTIQNWWWNGPMLKLNLRDETMEECVARGGSGHGWCLSNNSYKLW